VPTRAISMSTWDAGVGWTVGGGASPSTITVPIPGMTTGEPAYLIVHSKPSTVTPGTPTNWSLVGSVTGGAGTQAADTGATRITVFKRVAPSGGMPSSVDVSMSGGGTGTVLMGYVRAFTALKLDPPFGSRYDSVFVEELSSWSKTGTTLSYGGTTASLDLGRRDVLNVFIGATSDSVGTLTIDGIAASGGLTLSAQQNSPALQTTTTGNDAAVVGAYLGVTSGAAVIPVPIAATVTVTATGTGTGRTAVGAVLKVRATVLYSEVSLASPSGVVVEGPPVRVAQVYKLAAGGVTVVEGTSVTTETIPRVHARLGVGEIAVASGPVELHKILHLTSSDIAVEPTTAVFSHILKLAVGDVVAEPLAVGIAGHLATVDLVVEGRPVQISYGSTGAGGRGGIRAVPEAPTTRFIAQSILTGEFLHWDLPVVNPTITLTLSGPTSITGDLSPEDPEIRDLLQSGLEPWACWIHVETDGLIRASGILQPFQIDDEVLSVEAMGPSAYLHGTPYLAELTGIQIDPADVVRAIWAHVQSYPDGRLGVTVNGTTPVRIGEPAYTTPKLDADGKPEKDPDTGAVIMEEVEAKPYSLAWWEGTDCGSEVDKLAQEAPFDYIERCAWNADRTGVNHWIDLGYPRIGARRDDLRFATGENVTGAVPAEEVDDLYASQVVLYGKGEGRDTIRGYAGRPLRKRLRRVAIIQDSTIATADRAAAISSDDLERRQGLVDVTDIEVDARHLNAQFGTYAPGDDILIDVEVGWLGRLRQYERILSVTYAPDGEAVRLQLRRAEAFRYGGVA
jgi:hypothetical protein